MKTTITITKTILLAILLSSTAATAGISVDSDDDIVITIDDNQLGQKEIHGCRLNLDFLDSNSTKTKTKKPSCG